MQNDSWSECDASQTSHAAKALPRHYSGGVAALPRQAAMHMLLSSSLVVNKTIMLQSVGCVNNPYICNGMPHKHHKPKMQDVFFFNSDATVIVQCRVLANLHNSNNTDTHNMLYA
jgi:hypothetical protein